MEIIILLTIIWLVMSLEESTLQAGKIYPKDVKQIDDIANIKIYLLISLFEWAVKLIRKEPYLLNTVTLNTAQKSTQTTLIYTEFPTFRG